MGFFKFIGSPAGRTARIVAGAALVALGFFVMKGTGGTVLGIVGILPLAAGLFDWCIFAPLAGLPFVGSKLREAVGRRGGA